MKWIQSLLSKIISPFFAGLLVTAIVTTYCFFNIHKLNLDSESDGSDHNLFLKFLQSMHQKSIDQRFALRGYLKEISPDVALLAVDEDAVSKVGRWPWPREVLGKAIDRAYQHGAKVIAFDAVFAEPSAQPTLEVYEKLKSKNLLSGSLHDEFYNEVQKRNSDKIMSEYLGKKSDQVVLGTFYESSYRSNKFTYRTRCYDMIAQQTPAYSTWQNDESYLGIFDKSRDAHPELQTYFPDSIKELYLEALNVLEQEIREVREKPKNRHEEIDLSNEIFNAKTEFCHRWLSPEEDALYGILQNNWSALKEQDEDIQEATFEEWVAKLKYAHLINPVEEASHWVMNIKELSQIAKNTGFFNARQDSDGTIRRASLFVRSGDFYMPSIALKAYLTANHYMASIEFEQDMERPQYKQVSLLEIKDENDQLVQKIPLNREGTININYAGSQKRFPHVSMAELLTDSETMTYEQLEYNQESQTFSKVPIKKTAKKSDFFKNKILIFGATAVGIYDLRVTPFEENYPGAETHVNVVNNLITQNYMKTLKNEPVRLLITLLLFGLSLSYILSQFGAIVGFLTTIGLFIGTALIDFYFFFSKGTIVTIIFPLGLILFQYVFLTFYKYFTEEKNKRMLKGTFAKYVSPSIVDEVLKDPENIELGGKKQRMTVFFSDIRGFTTISEQLDPKQLSDLLNHYLTPMTEIVFQNKGTLDKYMGDAVMAFFGAPISYPDHASCACRCALQQIEKLKELQKFYKEQGLPHIDIGIGINTGDMSVGNMGSETVRNYTVMGDAVNLGSRLEGINKQYKTRIIISEFTYQEVKDQFVCREVDWVRVKGKLEPVKIYELIAEKAVPQQTTDMLEHYNQGFELYHQMRWKEALEKFEQATQVVADDGVSQLYKERCQNYINEPPPQNWDGVFVMKSK